LYVERVEVTEQAKLIIDQLRAEHGQLIFHQSGGCCDGTMPMCFQSDDFIIGARDLCLGVIHGCKFYMASDQFEYYKNMHICIDVCSGRGSSFSLEIPLGVRFMTVSRVFSEQELVKVRPVQKS